MTTAVQVNPYATDEFAAPIKSAIETSREERQRRLHNMREVVAENNIYKWAADLMSALGKVRIRNRGLSAALVVSVEQSCAEHHCSTTLYKLIERQGRSLY